MNAAIHRPLPKRNPMVLLAIVTAAAHLLVAMVAAAIVLAPAPRWFVLYEISGTPLPLPSRLGWNLSIWLRQLLPLIMLIAPFAFVADTIVAGQLFNRPSRRAGWLWLWGVLLVEVIVAVLWIGALLLPRLYM